MDASSRHSPTALAAASLAVLVATCVGVYGALWWLDFGGQGPTPWELARSPKVADALAGLGEVVVGILGIAITVVAIVVELASNRYTPRISEMFVRDPVNVAVMGFFVTTATLVLWVSLTLGGDEHPDLLVLAAVGCTSASLLLLLPYFAYVFDFLTPQAVITRFRKRAEDVLHRDARLGVPAQLRALAAIEQLGELAVVSVEKNDKAIALDAVAALASVASASVRQKAALPPVWLDATPAIALDQDFVSLHPDSLSALARRGCWLEMKVLRQYQAVFGASLNRVRDVAHLVAMHTRQLGETAQATGDAEALALCVRFLNTYLRATINARDVRTAYNLLNEYRGLAESQLHDGPRVLALAEHFKYYGQAAFHANLGFILETCAYDLCALLERAGALDAPWQDALLDVLLELDHEPESAGRAQEASLRGVRKAQIKLATWYLSRGDEPRARRIHADMRAEQPARLLSIRAELEAITAPEFWEVSDRGINFDWLPDAQRAQLPIFFAWFERVAVGA